MKRYIFIISILLFLSGCNMKPISSERISNVETIESSEERINAEKEETQESSKGTVNTENVQKVVRLGESVEYECISIEDTSLQLIGEEAKGWKIDINSDDIPEKIYMNSIGIYIDGILAISAEDCGENLCFWLVDIDKGDGYIELLTYHDMAYDLWYYDKKGNIKSAGKSVCGWYDVYAEYNKATDIRKPIRIDEQTVSFKDWFFLFDSYSMNAYYQLDEKHQLYPVPKEYEIENPHPIAFINQNKTLKLYHERDRQGNFSIISEPTVFMLTKSDGVLWVYLENYMGESGWIYVEEGTVGDFLINNELIWDDFIGYSNIP